MDAYPPIAPVRVRTAGESHAGPMREYNEDAFGIFDDATSAIAMVADGMGGHSSGRRGADLCVDTCKALFEGRKSSILDDLAEAWWNGEHPPPPSSDVPAKRPRPYSTLPVVDRVELREHVKELLAKRVPQSMGDVATLEAETRTLLDLPTRIMQRANGDLHRRSERDMSWRGTGAAVVCAIFAAGQASLAWVGDGRISRYRAGTLEALTTEHSLINEYLRLNMELTPEQLEEIPRNVITRAIGMTDTVIVDQRAVPVEKGDVFLLMCDGIYNTFSDAEIKTAVRDRGIEAAPYLVDVASRPRPGHSGDNVTLVAVEIL